MTQPLYGFYVSLTNNGDRKQRAVEGLKNGSIRVTHFRSEPNLIGAQVVSASGHTYRTQIDWTGIFCDCPDFARHGADHKRPCKHLLAVMLTDQAQGKTSQQEAAEQRTATANRWARRRQRWADHKAERRTDKQLPAGWLPLNPHRPDDDRMVCPTCHGVFARAKAARHSERCRYAPRTQTRCQGQPVSGTVEGFTISLR